MDTTILLSNQQKLQKRILRQGWSAFFGAERQREVSHLWHTNLVRWINDHKGRTESLAKKNMSNQLHTEWGIVQMKSFSRGSANTRNCYADYAVSLGLFYAVPRIREFLSTLSGLANRFSLGEIIQRNIFASVFNSRPTNQKLPFFDITPMSLSGLLRFESNARSIEFT